MAATPEQTQTIANYYRFILQREPDDAGLANWSAVVPQFFSINDVRAAFVSSAEAQNNVAPLIRLYQTALNRVPDQGGLDNWADVLRAGTSLRDVATAFANSAEFQANFPGTGINEQLVRALYRSALDRTPESSEVVQSWVNSGLSRSDLLLAFANSPESLSRTASPVTTFLDRAGQGDAAIYSGNLYDALHAPGGSSGGQTFTLTTNADNIAGTAGNDAINGLIGAGATLSAADQIDGGAGTDTLNITYADAGGAVTDATQGALISGVEQINIRNTNTSGGNGVTVNATGLTGVSASGLGDVSVTNLASGATFTANGTPSGVFNVGYVAAATNASLALNGATTGNITVTGAGITTAAIASTGAANTAGTIDVANATTINVSAATNLTVTDIVTGATGATLNVSGAAASVNLGVLDAGLSTINASGLTAGGLTATLSDPSQVVTGGAGADIITTGGTGLVAGSVNAGAGTDRLVASNTTDLDTAAEGAKYTNFEVLQVQDGVSVDLDNISGITAIRINDAATATGVTNLTAAQAAAVTVIAGDDVGDITIGVKSAATPGNIDTVSITADDGAATPSIIELGTPVIANVERLSINAVDNVTLTALTGAAAVDAVTLTGAGTQSITTGAITATNFSLNGSAATGALTLNAAAATVAVGLTGGSAADGLTGSAQADNISGGAGADTIASGDGADTVTGGAGADTFLFGSLTGADTIADYVVADDSIQLSAATFVGLTTVATNPLTAAEFESGAGLAAAATTAGRIVYNTTSGALYFDADGSGGAVAVQIATLTGAPTLAATEFTVIA